MRKFPSIVRTSVMVCALLNGTSRLGLSQATPPPPASAHQTIHVLKGDTIVPAFAILTDSVLKLAGYSVKATALGNSKFIVRWRVHGALRAVDTLNLIVDSTVAAVPPDTTPKSPPPVVVASVQTTLGLSTLTLGQTTQAIFGAKDSTGTIINGRTALWSSLNTNVASVTPFGLVTAMGIGGTSIRATVDGRSGDAAVVVNPPTIPTPPTPGHPNEPVGMNQLAILSGDVAPTLTWSSLGWVGSGITTATDTVPGYGQTSVLQATFPAGFMGGSSPARTWTQPSASQQDWQIPVRTIYQSFWYRYSPNYPTNLVANKMIYTQINHSNSVIAMTRGTSDQGTQYTAPIHPMMAVQNILKVNGDTNISQSFVNWGMIIPRGQWVHFELLYVANTAGHADGMVRMWQDGAIAVDLQNVQWDRTGAAGQWNTTFWDPVYGGGGQVPFDAVNAFNRIKDFYVSGKQ